MSKSVTIYTTPTCGYCKAAKGFFQENDIEYSEIDVAADQEKAKEMIEMSGQMGVPVIKIGDGDDVELVVGFDQKHLARLLDIES